MDTITHGLTGWLVARAIPPEKRAAGATAALVVGSVLPDADNIASLFGSETYLRFHRGISHGFAGVAVTSLLVALLLCRLWRWEDRRWKDLKVLYLLALAGQFSHIALDLLNSYGTQVFQPFSDLRVSFDLLFVVDLAFTGIIAAGLFLSRGRPAAARTALAALLLYVGAAGALHLRAEGVVQEAAASHGVRVMSTYALPTLGRIPSAFVPELGGVAEASGDVDPRSAVAGGTGAEPGEDGVPFPAGPFAWNGFVDDGATYLRAEVDPFTGGLAWKERMPKGERVAEVQALRGIPDVRTYLWFARFPTVSVTADGRGRTVVSFFDLRFGGAPARRPFILTIIEEPGRPPRVRWGS